MLAKPAPAVAALLAGAGLLIAAGRFPGGFDWQYQVVSALASPTQNPGGSVWFALGLALSMLALWPVTTQLHRAGPLQPARVWGVRALRVGLLLGVLVGLERLPVVDAPVSASRLHELLALACFASLYVGIVAICAARWQARGARAWPAPAMIALFTILAGMLLFLWATQRELGWVGRDWRSLGIPLWRSFAFWQWITVAGVWAAFACFAWCWSDEPAQPTSCRSS